MFLQPRQDAAGMRSRNNTSPASTKTCGTKAGCCRAKSVKPSPARILLSAVYCSAYILALTTNVAPKRKCRHGLLFFSDNTCNLQHSPQYAAFGCQWKVYPVEMQEQQAAGAAVPNYHGRALFQTAGCWLVQILEIKERVH